MNGRRNELVKLHLAAVSSVVMLAFLLYKLIPTDFNVITGSIIGASSSGEVQGMALVALFSLVLCIAFIYLYCAKKSKS